ncbi:hypothetical protein KC324_g14265 [Hortaea werneckii]|nr:hypothetical protein KC324_g14265 [Hortaea werneckii]
MEDDILARLRLGLLAVLPITTFFNLAYFVLGAVATGVVDYIWFEDGVWYTRSDDGDVAGHGAQLFFFYCTIPLLLTILTTYETLHLFLSSRTPLLSETSPRMTFSAFPRSRPLDPPTRTHRHLFLGDGAGLRSRQ